MGKTIVVIGGGPGGYVTAIRAAQLGATVHLVEENNLGGTCLNVGCIPTKALIHTAENFHKLKGESKNGLIVENARVDWQALQKHKEQVVKKLVRGVTGLLAANGVTVHNGRATVCDNKTVEISNGESITADNIILATGSSSAKIPFEGADLESVIDSTGALSLTELPESMCILGGGVIGCEFAYLFNALGVKVTVVEMLPQILPPVDGQAAAIIREDLTSQGVIFMTDTKMLRVKENGSKLDVIVSFNDAEQAITCDKLIVAVGRRANTENMGLDEVGVKRNRGLIEVDKNFKTSVPGIFAIGDCNGKIMLAHAASAQGVAAVEYMLGHKSAYNGNVIPSCIYTSPEVAGVGLTEEQAKQQGLKYKVGIFQITGNGKAMIEGCTSGIIKIIASENDSKILGAHMVGPRVTDMIGEIAVAMQMNATVEDIINTIHAHPTVSEAIAEAALDANGVAIHWPPQK